MQWHEEQGEYSLDMRKEERVKGILEYLENEYGEAICTLDYIDPVQLLIATRLAAQCTDVRVNIVTKDLFVKYPDIKSFAECDVLELEQDIKSTGFYHNKAKNIKDCCQMLLSKFGGEVPRTMEELLSLPGVGRKTANLLLGDAFGIPGIVIDTHAKRLSNRIGLTTNTDPTKIEFDLRKIIPKDKWIDLGHQFVEHGRKICDARKPKCDICGAIGYCKYGQRKKD